MFMTNSSLLLTLLFHLPIPSRASPAITFIIRYQFLFTITVMFISLPYFWILTFIMTNFSWCLTPPPFSFPYPFLNIPGSHIYYQLLFFTTIVMFISLLYFDFFSPWPTSLYFSLLTFFISLSRREHPWQSLSPAQSSAREGREGGCKLDERWRPPRPHSRPFTSRPHPLPFNPSPFPRAKTSRYATFSRGEGTAGGVRGWGKGEEV